MIPYSEMTEAERAAVEAFKADNETMNVKQAAAVLGVSTRTVMSYVASGRLQGVKLGGKWRFTTEELQRLIHGESRDE